jgi:hypothetical protein
MPSRPMSPERAAQRAKEIDPSLREQILQDHGPGMGLERLQAKHRIDWRVIKQVLVDAGREISRSAGNAKQVIDETGKRYGMLLVVRRAPKQPGDRFARWLCRCDCGAELALGSDLFRHKGQRSCGCMRGGDQITRDRVAAMNRDAYAANRLQKYLGKKFGRLTVLGGLQVERKPSLGGRSSYQPRAACQCECGNFCAPKFSSIRQKKTLSCGCYAKEQSSARGERILRQMGKAAGRQCFRHERPDGRMVPMRSRFEMMFATYLDRMGYRWLYEPRVFMLSASRRYTPDFYVFDTDTWYEVKGWLTDKARSKIEDFRELYPAVRHEVFQQARLEELLGETYKAFRKRMIGQGLATEYEKKPRRRVYKPRGSGIPTRWAWITKQAIDAALAELGSLLAVSRAWGIDRRHLQRIRQKLSRV